MRIDWRPSSVLPKVVIGSIVLVTAYLLKAYYSGANSDDLIWIIGPVAYLVELVSTLNFVHEPGYGWADFEHGVVIAPACAGVNFYIIAFCMSAFQLTHRVQSLVRLPAKLLLAGFLSYGVAILANAVRIVLSTYSYNTEFHSSWLASEAGHRIVGTCVFYLLLLSYSRILSTLLNRQAPEHRTDKTEIPLSKPLIFLVPLVWYLAFSLGVPFANRAFQANPEMFVRHALDVVAVTVALTLICMTSRYLIIRFRKV